MTHQSRRLNRGAVGARWTFGPALLAMAGLLACGGTAPDQAVAPAAAPAEAAVDGLEARMIDVEGVATRYYDYGEGEPIVLVHGGGMGGASTANNWSRNIPGLTGRFRVLAVDRLAQGMTGNPADDEDFTTRGAVRHIYQFIQTMKLGQVHLVGHSSGGGVAMGVAVEHPEVVKTLTLAAYGAGLPTGEGPRKFDAILAECPPDPTTYEHRKCRLLALGHAEGTFPPDYAAADDYMGNLPKAVETRQRMDALRDARPGWLDEQGDAYRRGTLEKARAGALSMPILMVAGKQDTLGWDADDPHSMQRRQMGLLDIVGAKNPRVKLVVLNEAGHFPYREHPEQFNAVLARFIEFWNAGPTPSSPGAQPGAQVGPNGEIDGLTATFADVNGVRTRYYDYGEGEPIVLVHGGGMGGASQANNWSSNIRGLAERFRVIAVDRLAQGMTGNPSDDGEFTSQGAARHLYQFIQTLKLGPVHLVGHSSGGGIAIHVAVEHPEIIRTLTVVAHGGGMRGEGPTKFDAILAKCPPEVTSYEHRKCRLLALGHTPDTFPADYAEADDFMGNLPKAVDTRKRMDAMRAARPGWPDEQNSAYRKQAHEKVRSGALQAPVLIYAAKQDTLGWDAADPHSMMQGQLGLFDLLGTRNPRVRMIVINEAGHFPYREHPELFNADLVQFIEFWNARRKES